ncbi:MAG: hypothetical protein DYG92_01245 [Leptolyngbya sp. PLA1]|nr:hypothetical protein [Leptolyngbya sp. PLA1]
MPVLRDIRVVGATPGRGGPAPLDLGDLAREGETLLEAARKEAAAIRARAMEEREALLAEARREGLAKGHAEGLEAGRREGFEKGHEAALAERRGALEQLEKEWGAALKDLTSRREAILAEARERVLTLAMAIASSVLRRTVESGDPVVLDQVRAVLEQVGGRLGATLDVNPADLALVERALPAICRELGSGGAVELRGAEEMGRGSCRVVMAGGGEISGELRVQLERIAGAIGVAPGWKPEGVP